MFREAALAAACLGVQAVSAYTLQKRDGAGGGHAHAPAPSTGGGYSAPAQSYEEPASSYSGGGSSYGQATSYGGGYDEGGFPDLTPIILGILVLTGLSLLFPTYVSLTTVRRKRSLDGAEDVDPMTDMLERVNDIYMAVVESEECMERIACEVGGLAGDFNLKENTLAKVAEPFVPSKYKQFYKQFTNGKDCQKIKCGTFNF